VIETRKAAVQNTYWGSRLVDKRRYLDVCDFSG
jgi:hypothetical protein